jgi:hypothetical protein
MTEEDEAFERIQHAQGWRKRQVADQIVLTMELDPYREKVRDLTIEEVAQAVEKFSSSFGPDTVASFAAYIRGMKR